MLGLRIADYLLERGRVTRAQIDEARRTQGFFGGQIESHLLKLGYVSESVLGEALTEIAGVPFASWEHLRAVPPDAIAALPVGLAERFRICPFRLDDGRLRVATLNPRDGIALREIQTATGLMVEPWITIETRLYQALERYYRLRFEGTKGITLAPSPDAGPRPRPAAAGKSAGSGPAAEPEIGLDGRPLDAEVSLDDYLHRPAGPVVDGDNVASARALPSSPEPLPRSRRPDGRVGAGGPDPSAMALLDDALASALDRDGIAEALFDFSADRARRAGLFAVGRDGVRGIAGRGRAFDTGRLRNIVMPIGSGTIFDTALQSRDFYFGVVPGLPANRDLYTALGGRLPTNVLLLPIVLKERTVALLYLDGDDAPLTRPDIPAMRRVAAKAGLAFELLLLRNKLREI